MEKILEKLKHSGPLGFNLALFLYKPYRYLRFSKIKEETYLQKKFYRVHGATLDLHNPQSFNEKLNWLKLNDRREISTLLADKFLVRDFIAKNFGDDLLIPLIFETKDVNDLRSEELPEDPFIVKTNHDSGHYLIVRNKDEIDWKRVRIDFEWWLHQNYYDIDKEWPYKNISPRVIVEKLLTTKEGKIPNDYKLHCINGEVKFVYVSIDRENMNKRNIYDKKWNPLFFTLANKRKDISNLRGEEISPPKTYSRMVEIAEKIASIYPYVRVDFYDVNGKLYFGEVTHFHGGGNDIFTPIEWDYKWGKMINLKFGLDRMSYE